MQPLLPSLGGADLGGGLVTYQNFFALKPNQTPNAMNVKFGIGGTIEKRLGSTTMNSVVLIATNATGFSPDTNGTLGTNLAAFWGLNETAGTRIDAFSTNNLSETNVVGYAAGIIGNAANFMDTSNVGVFLSISDNTAISVGDSSFTISAWVYFSDTSALARSIAAHYDDTPDITNASWFLQYSSASNTVVFRVTNSANTPTTLTHTLTALWVGSWNLVIAWRDRANATVNIQLNNGATSLATSNITVNDSTVPLTIGAVFAAGSGVALMSGRIDEVGLWKKVLSVQERTDLYNSGNANTYTPATNRTGWGLFDFGAGLASGVPLRWLTVAAGTGIYASSNRGLAFVVIATDRRADYQYFERSKSFLIATSDTGSRVLYWAGSVGTFMSALAPGSAPPAKHALDFQGFLLLMNDSGANRRITYADNNLLTTDPWNTSFELPSSYDDEITGGIILNKKAYVSTKYRLYRISAVGGNPDFSYQEVKHWGWVPGTQKKITLPDIGEVICCLGWDRKLRLFDGSEDKIISDSIELDNGLSPFALSKIDLPNVKKSRAEVDTEEQVYKLWVAITPSTETTHMLAFNYRSGSFYVYDNQTFNGAVMAESSNTRILMGAKRDGTIHWINTTNLDLTAAIDEYYDSPFFFRGTPRVASKSQKITFYFHPTSSGTLYLRDHTDFDTTFTPIRETIRLTDTSSKVQIMKTVDIPMTQNIYQFRLTSSANTTVPWKLNRIDYESTDLGIGKA